MLSRFYQKKSKIIYSLNIIYAIIICGLFLFVFNRAEAQDFIWQEANTSGFDGDVDNRDIRSLATFGGNLYAGTEQPITGTGGQIWRSSNGITWNEIIADGFGDAGNTGISSLMVFGGFLYAGTENAAGLELWRSSNGTSWNAIAATGEVGASYGNGFGIANNTGAISMEIYNSYLYLSATRGPGAQIWRTIDGTTWTQINDSGFNYGETYIYNLESFGSNLYAGTGASRGEIWRCDSCNVAGDWGDVVGDGPPPAAHEGGFGDMFISSIHKLITFGSNIYAGTDRQINGGQVWRSSNGTAWTEIVGDSAATTGGFGDGNNVAMMSGLVSNGYLYFGTSNGTTGTEVWRSSNGTSWTEVVGDGADGNAIGYDEDGFGKGNNNEISTSMAEFNNHLYIGTYNDSDGAELFRLNYIPEGSTVTAAQSDDGDGKVSISFPIDDEDRDDVRAQIQYNIGSGWEDPTMSTSEINATTGTPSVNNIATYQINNISIPAVGENTITAIWNSETDIGSVDVEDVLIRVRYNDTISTSGWIESDQFDLDNVPPNPPTLDEVDSPTNISTQSIAGSKDAYASVILTSSLVTDVEIVDYDDETSGWSYSLSLAEGTNTLRLRSEDDKGNSSSTITGSIVLDTTAPNTEADPSGGTYIGIIDEVTLSSDEAGTTIYYTTDGSDPDLRSDTYADPLEITDNTTLKFFGVDSLGNQEDINEETYVLIDSAVRLTKSVSVESAEVAAAPPFEFKYAGLTIPSVSGGFNNLKAIALRSINFIKYPSYELYQKIAQILIILLLITFGIIVSIVIFRIIKNRGVQSKNFIKSLNLVYLSQSKLILGLIIFISLFALSESLIAVHMLSAADAEIERGDVLIYRIDYQNIGEEDVRDFYFVDSIPLFTEYNLESMEIDGTSVTDSSDIDNADFNNTWPGHTYFNIGDLSVGDSGYITFSVKVSDIAIDGALVSNRAIGGYNPGEIRVESNTVSNNVSVESIDDTSTDDDTSTSDTSTTTSTTSRTTSSRGGSVTGTIEDDNSETENDENSNNNSETSKIPDGEDSFTNRNGNRVNGDKDSVNQIIEEIPPISLFDNLKNINKFALAPILALLALLNLFSTFSLSNIVPFLRYIWQIFTEPLLYFGKGKRKGWGVVYNSQTKKPIDLALVRLYDKRTKKLIETKVTDFEGRYAFIVESGVECYMQVQKSGFIFPSKILASVQSDKNYKNIYHGEMISAGRDVDNKKKEQGYIAYDIPVDVKEGLVYSNEMPHKPIKAGIRNIKELEKASSVAIIREDKKIISVLRNFKIHKVLAFIGPLLGLASFVFTPTWIMFVLLLLHLAMLAFFIMLAKRKDEKPFGRIYNIDNSNSLSQSVVRLFDAKYGRLLSTTISKNDGRYGFLVGDNKYLLNSTKKGYILPEGKVEIEGDSKKIVKEDLGMKKSKKQ